MVEIETESIMPLLSSCIKSAGKMAVLPIKELAKNLEMDKEYYVKKALSWIKRNLES